MPVPDTVNWLVLNTKSEIVYRSPDQQLCIDFITSCRTSGNTEKFIIYEPNSCYRATLQSETEWSKA